MRTHSHSGDLGDIIYALPAIRATGGGNLLLYNDQQRTSHGMTAEKVDRLRGLLEYQNYIGSVYFAEVAEDSPLNRFRDHGQHGNLADMHLASQGLGWKYRKDRWIEVDYAKPSFSVILHRSFRYHNPRFPWQDIVEKYSGDVGFVGFRDEHEQFCKAYGRIPFVEASDFMELARIIEGAKLFIGNQSSPCAVAHGMKKKMIMEICPAPYAQYHCVYQRMDCILGWDEKLELPDMQEQQ